MYGKISRHPTVGVDITDSSAERPLGMATLCSIRGARITNLNFHCCIMYSARLELVCRMLRIR
jgi:hypothetical protein